MGTITVTQDLPPTVELKLQINEARTQGSWEFTKPTEAARQGTTDLPSEDPIESNPYESDPPVVFEAKPKPPLKNWDQVQSDDDVIITAI